ncbi:MAG: phytanoyl-CoA dioxygenase family protein [Acidobacteriota bacterium]|nr:phytanoyl-CoA dioxygenase family protein [Acidobacteriota bacterium]
MLSPLQIQEFVQEGFVKMEGVFSQEVATEARKILWRATGCDPDNPATWTRPVIRLGDFAQEPFQHAVNSPALHAAFDDLVGAGRWLPRESLGGFPIRFPHTEDPSDTGWHIDASFPPESDEGPPDNYFTWRVNVRSRGRALLMLFLFSDVGEDDAPTRIRKGSHLRVPRVLAHAGERGLSVLEISVAAAQGTEGMAEALATGPAGTVYLCHPFLVHAAQRHRGRQPKFMAQPPLYLREPLELVRGDGQYSPLERSIRLGLDGFGSA